MHNPERRYANEILEVAIRLYLGSGAAGYEEK